MIKHLLGVFKKPGKVRIYEAVQAARDWRRQWGKVSYRHTKRELNTVPDDMARRALEAEATVVYYDGKVPEDAPKN